MLIETYFASLSESGFTAEEMRYLQPKLEANFMFWISIDSSSLPENEIAERAAAYSAQLIQLKKLGYPCVGEHAHRVYNDILDTPNMPAQALEYRFHMLEAKTLAFYIKIFYFLEENVAASERETYYNLLRSSIHIMSVDTKNIEAVFKQLVENKIFPSKYPHTFKALVELSTFPHKRKINLIIELIKAGFTEARFEQTLPYIARCDLARNHEEKIREIFLALNTKKIYEADHPAFYDFIFKLEPQAAKGYHEHFDRLVSVLKKQGLSDSWFVLCRKALDKIPPIADSEDDHRSHLGRREHECVIKIFIQLAELRIDLSPEWTDQLVFIPTLEVKQLEEFSEKLIRLRNAKITMNTFPAFYADPHCLQYIHHENYYMDDGKDFRHLNGIKKLKKIASKFQAWPLPQHVASRLIAYIFDDETEFDERMTFFKRVDSLGDALPAYDLDPDFYNDTAFISNLSLYETLYKKLEAARLTYRKYPLTYKTLRRLMVTPGVTRYDILHATAILCERAAQSGLADEAGYALMHASINPLNRLVQGPIAKLEGTRLIEALLDEIITSKVMPDLSFDQSDYWISLPGGSTINLSIVLRHADLSQLRLSQARVEGLIRVFESIFERAKETILQANRYHRRGIYQKVSPIYQIAIAAYCGHRAHKNINALFRGEKLIEDVPGEVARSDRKLIGALYSSKNLLAYFLVGCVLNDLANQISILPEKLLLDELLGQDADKIAQYKDDQTLFVAFISEAEKNGKLLSLTDRFVHDGILTEAEAATIDLKTWFPFLASLYPSFDILDRGERLTEEVRKRRAANPWQTPAITSCSVHPKGSPAFQKKKLKRTKIEGYGGNLVVVHPPEDEVLLPQGTQIITVTENDQTQISHIVRSPSLAKGDHAWSDLALNYACKRFLSMPYQRTPQPPVKLGDYSIHRPNHGPVQARAVGNMLAPVIAYFAYHAADTHFKSFCAACEPSTLEWLLLASVFNTTGRQAENSAKTDLNNYLEDRKASADNFKEFVTEITPIGATKAMLEAFDVNRERFAEVIQMRGNPDYENNLKVRVDNQDILSEEASIRCYLSRILNTAHNLVLLRCYTAKKYKAIHVHIASLSSDSPEQTSDLKQLEAYADALLRAMGSKLRATLDANGEIIDSKVSYQPIFAEASNSVKRLIELSEIAPRPTFYERISPKEILEAHQVEGSEPAQKNNAKTINDADLEALIREAIAASEIYLSLYPDVSEGTQHTRHGKVTELKNLFKAAAIALDKPVKPEARTGLLHTIRRSLVEALWSIEVVSKRSKAKMQAYTETQVEVAKAGAVVSTFGALKGKMSRNALGLFKSTSNNQILPPKKCALEHLVLPSLSILVADEVSDVEETINRLNLSRGNLAQKLSGDEKAAKAALHQFISLRASDIQAQQSDAFSKELFQACLLEAQGLVQQTRTTRFQESMHA